MSKQKRLDPRLVSLTAAGSFAAEQYQGLRLTLEQFNLSVVPAGTGHGAVHQLLRSARMERLLKEARERYDFIVLDTPPLLPVFDSALLAKSVDGVLMVVSANRTPRKLLGEALNLLDPAKVLGIVFNRDARPLFGYYDAYYREYFPAAATGA